MITCVAAAVAAAATLQAGDGDSVQELMPVFAYIVAPGPQWKDGVRPSQQEGFDGHMAFLQELKAADALVAAGPFHDDAGGGMTLLLAGNLEAARVWTTRDPWIQSGHLVVAGLRPWAVGLTGSGAHRAGLAPERPGGAAQDHAPVAGARVLRKHVEIAAPIQKVWQAWTTSEGIAAFFSPESKIELRVGGPYHIYMSKSPADSKGKRGSEGCSVLSYIPYQMLSFEWNFPPSIQSLRRSHAKTHVVLRFSETAAGTVRVDFDQLGWGEGPAWDEGYAYFDKAWDWVLNNLKTTLE
ncbi:MAG: SRPBCC domain-containing protein [Planctomycetota bacterium]|jgi:uncharacterized protein YndB with AHSA1/START domain/uncharacterized protein YciI